MPDPITPRQAAMILMRASAVDNRDPSAAADEVWADALTRAGVAYPDCLAAVGEHYARSTDRLMPGHMIAIAREFARERAAAARNRAAIEATGPREGTLPRDYVLGQIQAAVNRAQAARRAREAITDGPATPPGPPGGGETRTGDLSGSAGGVAGE